MNKLINDDIIKKELSLLQAHHKIQITDLPGSFLIDAQYHDKDMQNFGVICMVTPTKDYYKISLDGWWKNNQGHRKIKTIKIKKRENAKKNKSYSDILNGWDLTLKKEEDLMNLSYSMDMFLDDVFLETIDDKTQISFQLCKEK